MRSLIVQSAAGQSEQERLQAELDKLRDELQAETEMSSEHKAALAEIQAAKELAVAELAEAQAAVADAATLQAAKLQEIEQAHKIEKQAALDAHDKERQSIIQSLQAKISEKESETERIERELQETTLKLQDAEQSAAAPLEEQVAKLTEELRVAGKAKLDAENKVQRLQTDKRLAEEGIQRQSSSLDKHAHALKMENTGLLEENSRLKAELDAAERSRVEREASHVRSRERTAELATEHADEVGVLKTEREAFEKQAVDAQAALDSASASHQAALQQAAEQAESARADLAKQLT
jgi:colicin import membrane protein